MISHQIRLENDQIWDDRTRLVGDGLLCWQLSPLGFGYISHSFMCCQATSPHNACQNMRRRPPKFAQLPAQRCVHRCVQPPRSILPLRKHPGAPCLPAARRYSLPRSSMPPCCQEITAALELPPKFMVLMTAIYYVLYSMHIISVPGCTGRLYRRLGLTRFD